MINAPTHMSALGPMLSIVHPELNPFTPGSGLEPPRLAGRDQEVSAFDLMVARSLAGRQGSSIVLHGYRGVGKTVLLNAMRE